MITINCLRVEAFEHMTKIFKDKSPIISYNRPYETATEIDVELRNDILVIFTNGVLNLYYDGKLCTIAARDYLEMLIG